MVESRSELCFRTLKLVIVLCLTCSILYNNDWASRISLASVLRFRTAAVQAHLETRTPVTSRSKNPPRSSPATESESDATQVNPAETNQKFGFLGSIKRRLRQWQSIACVAQALLHVLCFLTLEKDRTKSRNVIFRDRERHKAGLDVSKTDQHFDTHSSRESNVIAAEIGNGASEATGEHEEGSLREAEEGRAGLTAQAMGETEACTSVQSEGGRGWVESDPDDESSAKSSAQIVFSEPLANGSAGAEAALPPSVVYAEESRKAVSGQCQETAGVGCSEDVTPSASPTEERPSMQSSLEDDPQKEDRGSGVKRSNKEGSSSAPVIQAMVQDNFKPREMYVPGTIVHVVRVREGGAWPILSSGRRRHVAVLADRAALRKVPVHPNTFLDHMPWR